MNESIMDLFECESEDSRESLAVWLQEIQDELQQFLWEKTRQYTFDFNSETSLKSDPAHSRGHSDTTEDSVSAEDSRTDLHY